LHVRSLCAPSLRTTCRPSEPVDVLDRT
jgi:hypothetical protein